MRLSFIGLGVMGGPMAGRMLNAGHELTVFTRTRAKAEPLLRAGAQWAEHPAEAARNAEVVFTMVGLPADVREVYLGSAGILQSAQRGAICCDFTTSSPALAVELDRAGRAAGIDVLDAPVSGGDVGARNGSLSIMCGGPAPAFERVSPLLRLVGTNIVYQGEAGAGQHTKMCNQIAIASTMMGVCEALLYADAQGLDPHVVLQSISSGAAGSWTLDHLAPRILRNDFEPGFFIEHFIKDMRIAADEASRAGLMTPGLDAARKLYAHLAERGLSRKGTQALYLAYQNAVS